MRASAPLAAYVAICGVPTNLLTAGSCCHCCIRVLRVPILLAGAHSWHRNSPHTSTLRRPSWRPTEGSSPPASSAALRRTDAPRSPRRGVLSLVGRTLRRLRTGRDVGQSWAERGRVPPRSPPATPVDATDAAWPLRSSNQCQYRPGLPDAACRPQISLERRSSSVHVLADLFARPLG